MPAEPSIENLTCTTTVEVEAYLRRLPMDDRYYERGIRVYVKGAQQRELENVRNLPRGLRLAALRLRNMPEVAAQVAQIHNDKGQYAWQMKDYLDEPEGYSITVLFTEPITQDLALIQRVLMMFSRYSPITRFLQGKQRTVVPKRVTPLTDTPENLAIHRRRRSL